MGTSPISMHRYDVKRIIDGASYTHSLPFCIPISISPSFSSISFFFYFMSSVVFIYLPFFFYFKKNWLELYWLWGPFLFSVLATKCSVPEISNATYTIEGNWTRGQQSSAMKLHTLPHGTVLRYNCDQGFVIEGKLKLLH